MSGLHVGGHVYRQFKARFDTTFGDHLAEAAKRMNELIFERWGDKLPKVEEKDMVYLFNGKRRSPNEKIQDAFDEAVKEHGADALLQPLKDYPQVELVLSVFVTNRKLPMADLKPRVPKEKEELLSLVRAKKLRFTKPGPGEEPPPGTDPCPICYEDMRGIDGCLLPCGHAVHSDCIADWLHNHRTCPVCRDDVSLPASRKRKADSLSEQPSNP